jgi:hypothetical protein
MCDAHFCLKEGFGRKISEQFKCARSVQSEDPCLPSRWSGYLVDHDGLGNR